MSENGSTATILGHATTERGRRRLPTVTKPVLSLEIPGTPAGQGSMHLTKVASGKEVARYPVNTINHRNLAIELLRAAWHGRPPMLVPVAVACRFIFPRPATHFLPVNKSRPAPELRDDAPAWHSGARDVDKMQRLIGDALTIAGVVKDDGQIVLWRAEKPYGPAGLTIVQIHSLGPSDGE